MQVQLIEKDESKYISSRELARLLEKQHKHVLAKIRKNWLELWAGEGILFDRVGKKTNFALLTVDRATELLDLYQQNDLVVELGRALRQLVAERINLDREWGQVVDLIRPAGTQLLLRYHGHLISLSNNAAYIRIASQPLLNIVKDKIANIEAAFLQAFNRKVTVKMGLTNPVGLQKDIENSWSAAVVTGVRQTSQPKPQPDLEAGVASGALKPIIEENDVPASGGLSVFQFQSEAVRFLKVDGVDRVVGIDAARVLGYADPSAAVRDKVDKEYTCMGKLPMQGMTRTVTCISEPGIYQLIFSSKLPLAKEFQRWVFEEVLPSIRKTGGYSVKPESQQPKSQLQVLAETVQAMFEFEQKQLAVNAELKSELQNVKEQIEGVRSDLEENLQQFKSDRNLAQDNLAQLPLASEAPPSVSVRNAISMLVRNYCFQSGRSHSEVWRELYTDMKYRYSYDAIARTENWNRSNEKKRSYIDQCETDGMLGELHKVTTSKLFPGSSSQK